MALNYLSTPVSQGQSATASTAAAAAADEDRDDYEQKGEATKKSPSFLTTSKSAKSAGTLFDADSNEKDQRRPFLLTTNGTEVPLGVQHSLILSVLRLYSLPGGQLPKTIRGRRQISNQATATAQGRELNRGSIISLS